MFKTLAGKIPRDKDLPERTWRLQVLRAVIEGTIYDNLRYSFQTERSDGGEYIPLRDRRPSVRYNLCRMVVQDSVALLFGDGHFPIVELEDQEETKALAAIIKETKLAAALQEAAIRGAVGSIAILMRVLNNRIFFDVLDTDFLTPAYDPLEPDTLLSVTEKYKVKGEVLRDAGYTIDDNATERDFWFQRVWTRQAEEWYLPVPVATEYYQNAFKQVKIDEKEPELDTARTVKHALGFVPMVWIRNLPPGKGIDGHCTFAPAIDTQIEIEYQLSQAGRGLKYSSDPLLMIRNPASGDDGNGEIIRSPANALVVAEQGDAKMLEISGAASNAVIEYVRTLRESAIETIHGNRSSADKVSAAQSGRALEMMHQPLIWLADQLRVTYGENGLLPLIRMIVAAVNKLPIKARGKLVSEISGSDDPTLRWPAWFAPTGSDRQQDAAALATLATSGHISRETAVRSISASFDIEDVAAELSRIAADEAARIALAQQADAQVAVKEDLPS